MTDYEALLAAHEHEQLLYDIKNLERENERVNKELFDARHSLFCTKMQLNNLRAEYPPATDNDGYTYYCANCGEEIPDDYLNYWNYCPWCGAKMIWWGGGHGTY